MDSVFLFLLSRTWTFIPSAELSVGLFQIAEHRTRLGSQHCGFPEGERRGGRAGEDEGQGRRGQGRREDRRGGREDRGGGWTGEEGGRAGVRAAGHPGLLRTEMLLRPWMRSPVSNSSSAVTCLFLHHRLADTALLPATSVCFSVAFPASRLLLWPVRAALRLQSSTLRPRSARPEPKRSKGEHPRDWPVTRGQSTVTRSYWAERSGQATSAATFGTDPGSSRPAGCVRVVKARPA